MCRCFKDIRHSKHVEAHLHGDDLWFKWKHKNIVMLIGLYHLYRITILKNRRAFILGPQNLFSKFLFWCRHRILLNYYCRCLKCFCFLCASDKVYKISRFFQAYVNTWLVSLSLEFVCRKFLFAYTIILNA